MIFESLPTPEEAVDLLQQIADRPPKRAARVIDKPLVLYGAGELGKMALHLLETIGQPPIMIVDIQADRRCNDAFWQDKNLVAPGDVPEDVQEKALLAVTIATLPYTDLAGSLSEAGWRDIVPFYDIAEAYRDRYPLSNGWVLERFDKQDLIKTREVLQRWGDDISRAHHLQFLAWHRFREDWIFKGAAVTINDRYFIPEAMPAIKKAKIFLDVGAHHGKVTRRFMEMQPDFKKIWMFEPDVVNRQVIESWWQTLSIKQKSQIKILPYALARTSGTQSFFYGLGYTSQISSLTKQTVSSKSLDDYDISPDFIKIHVEGMELDVLQGAKKTLKRSKAIIALTVYHNSLGVWDAANWLWSETNGSYRLLMRLHSWVGTGAVIYAL